MERTRIVWLSSHSKVVSNHYTAIYSNSTALSSGTIAGIVLGTIIGLVLIAVLLLIVLFLRKHVSGMGICY